MQVRSCDGTSEPRLPHLFLVLLMVAAPLAEGRHSVSVAKGSIRYAVVAGDARMSPTTASSTEQARRSLSFGALVAYLAVALSMAVALLLSIADGFSSWVLLPCAGLNRRGRAPPFVRA
jgi:hypothetical protein